MIELKGKPISDKILAYLKEKISKEKAAPGLAVVLVGNDEASKLYVNLKKKRAQEIGIRFFLYEFDESVNQEKIIQKIKALNGNNEINGLVVQLPLPERFDTQKIIETIDARKDVDGFLSENVGSILDPVFPKAIMRLAESAKEDLSGKRAVAIVNSEKFGEAMKRVFEKRGIFGDYVLSGNFVSEREKIKKADMVVSAVGNPGFLKGEFFKDGAVIIDGGISKKEERVFGDVDREGLSGRNVSLSPVPGGVGPVTIACLLENVYIAYKNQLKK